MVVKARIADLAERVDLIPILARWHFQQWGELTGASSVADYEAILSRCASAHGLPLTLIAVSRGELLGSVNIVDCDMDIRPELKPWLAQLYVHPRQRVRGIGANFVHAALERSGKLGFYRLYLYTSGTLYYMRIGWNARETVHYREKDRTVMEKKLAGV